MTKQKGLHELTRRLIFVIVAIVVFRVGSFIPIPGINAAVLSKFIEQQHGTLIEIFNIFSGGALSRASIFALGIMPYISSSIIIQLLIISSSRLNEIKKDGELGRRKINQYTRFGTLILSIFQSIGLAISLPNMVIIKNLVINPGFVFYFTAIFSLICGTMILMWIGEQINERGIGNGISMIIFAGIIAGLPPSVSQIIEQARQGEIHFLLLIFIIIFMFVITFFVVFMERGQRRIIVSYAKRQYGRHIYASQNTHLPLKINMSGVMPAIFASSVILFPATLISWLGLGSNSNWISNLIFCLQPGQPFYIIPYASAIIFFCFFYTTLIFSPRETAENLKKSGAFIPGIRPGEQTSKYIYKIITRLTLTGSIYITFICLIPEFMRNIINIPFYFGGTSLLIIVVVIMDLISQIQTIIMSNQYDIALKKAKLKGYNI